VNPVNAISRLVVVAAVPAGMAALFRPEAARDLEAVLELAVTDADGRRATRFAVQVTGGRLVVQRRAAPEAGARVAISAGDIARLALGAVPWPALLSRRRLELSGDPFLALRFPQLFGFGER